MSIQQVLLSFTSKEHEVISIKINRNYSRKKLLTKAQQNIMNSFQVFLPGIKKLEVKE